MTTLNFQIASGNDNAIEVSEMVALNPAVGIIMPASEPTAWAEWPLWAARAGL